MGQRGRAYLGGQLEGTGSSTRWGLRGNYFLRAISRSELTWQVLENDGQRVRFRVEVPASDTVLLASERRFQVELPKSVITGYRIAGFASRLYPITGQPFVVADAMLKAYERRDPDLEQAATGLKNFLELIGVSENEVEGLGLMMDQFSDEVSGATATLVYVDGQGITESLDIRRPQREAERLSDEVLDDIELSLRRMNPLLAAYFLYPDRPPPTAVERRDTAVGQTWDVEASNLAGLFSSGLDHDVSGTVSVQRQADEGDQIVLKIVGADVRYHAEGDRRRTAARLDIEPGTEIRLAPLPTGGYRVAEATAKGEARVQRINTGTWLFDEKLQGTPKLDARLVTEIEEHGQPAASGGRTLAPGSTHGGGGTSGGGSTSGGGGGRE